MTVPYLKNFFKKVNEFMNINCFTSYNNSVRENKLKGLIDMTGTITKDYGYFKKGDKVEFVEYDVMGWMSPFYKVKNTTQNFVEWIEKRYIMWD